MRVVVDDARCTGHGRCYALAPEVFEPDDFGHCVVAVADGAVPEHLAGSANLGRDNCPEHAITVSD